MSNIKKLMASAAGGGGLNVEELFSTYLYHGTSSSQTITNNIDLAGEGGLVWTKVRSFDSGSATSQHFLYDTERGAGRPLNTDATNGDYYNSTSLTSFNSDGFSLGSLTWSNYSTGNYASWTFRKAPKFFDVVTYTGNGVDGRTVSHNLGAVPGCMIIKCTSVGEAWAVYYGDSSKKLRLDTTDVASATNHWYSTSPTATEFTLGTNGEVNNNGATYVAYLFANNNSDGEFGPTGDQDIIKCGTFTGNSSGVEIDLGFEAQWVLIKSIDAANTNWVIFDSMRGMTYSNGSPQSVRLRPNTNEAEASQIILGPSPTGISIPDGSYDVNLSGYTYWYMAIRRGPMADTESGDQVFNGSYGNSTQPPGWSIPTPNQVDASFDVNVGGGSTDNVTLGARLINFRYTEGLSDASGPTFYSWAGMDYGFPSGFRSSSNGSSDLGAFWSRRTGAFDVRGFKGTGANNTVTHSLNGEVGMAWLMCTSQRQSAWVYARPFGNTGRLRLTDATLSTGENIWNSTDPTDTTISINASYNTSGQTYMLWLFGNLNGISKVGSFTGNGNSSTGQDIDCGFSNGVRFVLIKCTSNTGNWYVFQEGALGQGGYSGPYYQLNKNQTGLTYSNDLSSISSGFNIKYNSAHDLNYSSRTFLYYAVAN